MKTGYYSRLAAGNIIKNRRLYVPNILAGSGLLAMFYIMETLANDDRITCVSGGAYLQMILPLGSLVLMFLSFILLLYTNSYIMKQRGRELGLYNVLGMEKRHITGILFYESFISAAAVLVCGIFGGIVLYRLAALFITRILGVESILGTGFVRLKSIAFAALFFALQYLIGFGVNCVRVAKMKPVELLKSGRAGEREPKIKWLFLLAGIAALGGGYYIALTVKTPYDAITGFFIAVILVIIGTYCLFIAGTIAMLKLLKSNPRYYYRKNHMIAVSGLLYRMKQNAVGLASITILATMVIVTVTATVSLYAGTNDTINKQFEHNAYVSLHYGVYTEDGNVESYETEENLMALIGEASGNTGLEIESAVTQSYLNMGFAVVGDRLEGDAEEAGNDPQLANFSIITAGEYEKISGGHIDLAENEVAVYASPANDVSLPGSFEIGDMRFETVKKLESFPISSEMYEMFSYFGVVVSSDEVFDRVDEYQRSVYGSNASAVIHKIALDFADENQAERDYSIFNRELYRLMKDFFDETRGDSYDWVSSDISIKWAEYSDLIGMYGTLLFLGILLSVVFLFTTALIIYYKQISEGYEDAERFKIMQKVGMSPDEVKAAIRRQIVLVFFLPLIVAAIHTAFASPLLLKLLKIMFLSNIRLYFTCMGITLAAFAIIYVLIYSITARVYYHIVK